MRKLALVALFTGLAGCLSPPSATQRLSDAAVEMNAATRFGRMDLALEHVGTDARADFARRHAAWGGRVRVVDLDFGGFDLVKRDEAEVILNVMWLRQDEANVRVTRVAQRWRDDRGGWRLVSEQRKDGDLGLLGEALPSGAGRRSADGGSGAAHGASPAATAGVQRRVIREE